MSQTEIRFLGGLETIGGNIISIIKENYQIITDFGAFVGADTKQLLDRSLTSQLISQSLLPMAEGVYPRAQLDEVLLESVEESSLKTIICLSHLHLDHLGSLGQISQSIPVYTSTASYSFYKLVRESNFLPNYEVLWQGIPYHTPLKHGPFTIEFKESDHDTEGASAIFIETEDLKLVYSGDVRLSGFNPERVLKWVVEANAFKPDILLLEGTSFSTFDDDEAPRFSIEDKISHLNCKNERQLLNKINQLMADHLTDLMVINTYPQNIKRLIELNKIASENNRKFVLDEAYYHFLQRYTSENISNLYYLSNDTQINVEAIEKTEIEKNPGDYLLLVDYERHQILYQLPAGIYLHSNGMPLGPFMSGYESFLTSMLEYGWEFYQAGVSGHASQNDLLTLAYAIQPKVIIPWHTFNPHVFGLELEEKGLSVFYPQYGKTYSTQQILEGYNE